MKKFLAMLVAATMLLMMVGCSSASEETAPADEQSVEETEVVEEVADEDNSDVAASAKGGITEKEAKEIACKHAGYKVENVEFTKCKKDKDDGVWQYEIEFIADEKEYEYDISVDSGKILDYDVDSVYDD